LKNKTFVLSLGAAGLLLVGLMFYKLGSLMGGLTGAENAAASAPVGWHGIYHHPLYLPLELLRSVDFFIFKNHGQTLSRLPNALLGIAGVLSFAWLIALWHSRRTAVLATLLFATGAWTLHTSRLASNDVLYLMALPVGLLAYTMVQRYKDHPLIWYGAPITVLLLLYIPGLVWLVLAGLFYERQALLAGWKEFGNWGQRFLYILIGLVGISLLVRDLLRPGELRLWVGLPAHFPGVHELLKQFLAVPVHLFIRGPQYPAQWLDRTPLLDIFTLAACMIGIYFYATHLKAARTRLLLTMAIIGWILVGLGGPVSLSLLVPLLYVAAAAGLAYLVHEWFRTFPRNPLARGLGLGIVILAVALSCLYNAKAYFVAWPHNAASQAVFQYRRLR